MPVLLITALLALQVICFSAAVSAAEDDTASPEAACFSGEYIVSASPVRARREKTVDEFDEAVTGPVSIADEGARVMLLETRDADAKENGGRKVSYEKGQKLCEQLRRKQRAQRLASVRMGTREVVRRISCSCNGQVNVSATPNDGYWNVLWGLHGSNDVDMDAPAAWNLSTGSDEVVVVVTDTGVDYTHPDLRDNMWINPGETAANGIDDDGNGYIDDIHGINAITNSGNPMDDNGHGTHCAGTIGGRGNNGIGVAGVNWRVKIMATKFLSSSGSGSFFNGIKSIDYATMMKNRGVNVIVSNNSWGGQGLYQPVREAIERARNAGIVFVAAAGNNATNNDTTPFSPAAEGVANIISVAALNSDGTMAYFSNFGAASVHVGAPGVSIASTYPGDRYVYLSGTSMASPHVAGAVALLASYNSTLDWSALRSTILNTGRPLGALAGKSTTGKMVNLYSALSSVVNVPQPTPTLPGPTATATATPSPTRTATPTPTPEPGYFTVRGTVTVGGQRIAGAKIKLQTAFGTFVRTTDENGEFSFASVYGPSNYVVTITKGGYTFSTSSGYMGGAINIDSVGQPRTFTLSGLMLYDDGTPCPLRITVAASGLPPVQADSQGRFSFAVEYGQRYTLTLQDGQTWSDYPQRLDIPIWGDRQQVFVIKKDIQQ